MVKAGAQLKELLDVEEWTENLTRVSLMHNQIKEISFCHSWCLLSLLLQVAAATLFQLRFFML
jgi:disease resistance protein RPS2